jgi:hypothetical protein
MAASGDQLEPIKQSISNPDGCELLPAVAYVDMPSVLDIAVLLLVMLQTVIDSLYLHSPQTIEYSGICLCK